MPLSLRKSYNKKAIKQEKKQRTNTKINKRRLREIT